MDYEYWARRTRGLYDCMRQTTAPYYVEVAGLEIRVDPGVFAPEKASGRIFAEVLPGIVGKRSLLEIGTGTGIIALRCALQGSEPVVTTDINRSACRNACDNLRRYGVKPDVRLGNLFDPIRSGEQFQVIFWNHPFNWTNEPVKDQLDRAGFDYCYQGLCGYLRDARKHRTQDGVVLLGTGSFARLDVIEAYAKSCGYRFDIIWRQQAPLGSATEEIEFLVYEFRA